MFTSKAAPLTVGLLAVFLSLAIDHGIAREVMRPEPVRSKREIVYDRETYAELAKLWRQYHEEYPSEDAYANWMYAARYAGAADYGKLLEKGLEKYPANPVLLYLAGIVKHGKHNWSVGRDYLERAAALDPTFSEPWFSLAIHYMDAGDEERMDVALRQILESGAIPEEVMDYSYNMLAGLESDAILVTNGDNDTYPGLILTRLLDYRSDVSIVNRSLLNTTWYPGYLADHGLPAFVTRGELDDLRAEIQSDIKAGKAEVPAQGPYADLLLERLVAAAFQEGRPVYFAVTLSQSAYVKQCCDSGHVMGLATLIEPGAEPTAAAMRRLLEIWVHEYRTGGMDGWRLRHSRRESASRTLMTNYAGVLLRMMDAVTRQAPEFRIDLFRWQQRHLAPLLPAELSDHVSQMWCNMDDLEEIETWCRQQGFGQ